MAAPAAKVARQAPAPTSRSGSGQRSAKGRPAQAAAQRPALSVVPRPRRRWATAVLGLTAVIVMGGLFAAAVFHTQLASRQLRIDELERAVLDEQDRFAELRYQRAELRAPSRLAAEATALGLVPAESSRFVDVDANKLARQIAAGGPVTNNISEVIVHTDPLGQFRDVKAVSVVDE